MVMTRDEYEALGYAMTKDLGMEDRKVVLYWKALEEERWLACNLLSFSWKKEHNWD